MSVAEIVEWLLHSVELVVELVDQYEGKQVRVLRQQMVKVGWLVQVIEYRETAHTLEVCAIVATKSVTSSVCLVER